MLPWLSRKIHPSWLIAWFCAGAIIGVATSIVQSLQLSGSPSWLVGAAAFALVSLSSRARASVVLIMLAGTIFGLWRGSLEQRALVVYAPMYGQVVQLSGTVSDDVSYGPHGDQRIILKEIETSSKHLPGQIWISSDGQQMIWRSDRLYIEGKLGSGFGSAAASIFRAHIVHIVRSKPGDIGLRVRDWFAGGIRASIPEPEASLASGYLVGQRSTLPADLDSQLKTVGLTHVVVASGCNLTILVGVARRLLRRTSKYLATMSGFTMIASFMAISGLSPSMTRAGLVTGLSLLAWYYGRRIHPLVLIPFTAAVTALINPFYIWGDIGWYLSFTSFAGVIILAPLIQHVLWRGKDRPSMLAQIVIETMSAQLATLPIMIFAFGHYSPYALLANLLILPLIPLTMLLTFIAGLAGVLLPDLAHIFGAPATIVLHYMTTVVSHLADLPGAQGDLHIEIATAALLYAILVASVCLAWRKTQYDPRHEVDMSHAT